MIQGRFLSISDHHTNSLFTLILCLLFISSVLGAVMCVVALLQCVEQMSCSVVFSYNVVQLPCCFFLPVFAELCSRRTGLSKVFLFFFNKADF